MCPARRKPPTPSGLERIQRELARGDLDAVRRAILELEDDEQELLDRQLGEAAARSVRMRARRAAPRGRKRGRVVVLHGIMGSMLDVVAGRDVDRVWIDLLRLVRGRIADLELDEHGKSRRPELEVRTAGLHARTYLPLLLQLDEEWEVRPFAYDWRQDLEASGSALAREIRGWSSDGQPVHLVAHSMGGLVARSMIRQSPELWRALDDASGAGRGGRLVMLGTPNHGSYAIPLAFCGQEKLVRWLERADLAHDLPALLAILASFPGSYQMLPSPSVDAGDAHEQLYSLASWGELPVREALLQRARDTHEWLSAAVDRGRFVYVAGYDQRTPFRIRIPGAGRFEFQTTLEGDGRVPHALGLLDGVPTWWVREAHGDLPRNDRVQEAIGELLEKGTTTRLESARPSARALPAPEVWRRAEEVDAQLPIALAAPLAAARGAGAGADAVARLSAAQRIAIESALADDYLGRAEAGGQDRPADAEARARRAPAPIEIEVVWGDATRVDADVHTVGHYQGVLPQRVEGALDRALSGAGEGDTSARLVITEHAVRGTLRGALGDVDYFPWRVVKGPCRTVAVAGMGRPGSFTPVAARHLWRDLFLSVSLLPRTETLCTVLIGSGEGTLTLAEAVDAMIDGIDDARARIEETPVRKLRIVELYRDRAQAIRTRLAERAAAGRDADWKPRKTVVSAPGGRISDEDALGRVLDVAAQIAAAPAGGRPPELFSLLSGKEEVAAAKRSLASRSQAKQAPAAQAPQRFPTRISVTRVDGILRMAAITETTTVSERVNEVDARLIDRIVAEINDPEAPPRRHLARYLTRLLVPRELLEPITSSDPIVFEVDRDAAPIHWEMLSSAPEDGDARPLGVGACVARQLRTTYSPPPGQGSVRRGRLRVLIVGDPGDPAEGESLPGARREAAAVHELFSSRPDIELTTLIGAPGSDRGDVPTGVGPAGIEEVLDLLMDGGWDVLHYCGHGDFHPRDPSRAGWLFAGGIVLTAREIERLEEAPALVVANACLSARTSTQLRRGKSKPAHPSEAGLLPSIADEFFRLGARNYVGTSWEVNDAGAVLFARELYQELLSGAAIGPSVRQARGALYEKRRGYGKLWGAYQHYGDPLARVVDRS